jgi:hypothetical protein
LDGCPDGFAEGFSLDLELCDGFSLREMLGKKVPEGVLLGEEVCDLVGIGLGAGVTLAPSSTAIGAPVGAVDVGFSVGTVVGLLDGVTDGSFNTAMDGA